MPVVSVKDLTTDLLIRYGFQILGALVIVGVGLLLARWVGNLMGQWLERRNLEPPVRSLMVKAVRVVVLIPTALAEASDPESAISGQFPAVSPRP